MLKVTAVIAECHPNMINSPGGRDMRQPPICAGVWLLAHIG
jgi:hypothetical protein